MPMLDNTKIEEIRKSVNIIDIIAEYLPLTQRGRNFFGVCPFHDDHSPSMSVSPELQIYTCFSCGATGNVFKFIMDYENIPFLESVKLIAAKGGIDVDLNNFSHRKIVNNELYEMYDIARKLYQNNISSELGLKAKEYLHNREFDDEVIKEFGIGLSLIKNDILTNLLLKKEYKNSDILKTGLVIEGKSGMHDIYSNRIMFPLTNLEGKVVGFSGRIYNGEETSKYINTKETEIFKKGEILYNYYRAKDECRIKQTVIVMEGFMDVIRAYTIGVKNVVASMGTAITKNQAILLKRLAPNIILLFDGDAAGEKATISCIKELANVGITPKVVRLEDNMDPDDYIKKFGHERFIEKLNNPLNVMEFKMQYLKSKKNLNDSVELAKYINECIDELNQIDDDILREITIKKIVAETSISENLLRSKLIKKEKVEKIVKKVTPSYGKYEIAQRNLIFYMIVSTEVIKKYIKKTIFLPNDDLRGLANKIRYYYEAHDNQFVAADFYTHINNGTNEIAKKLLNEILNMNLKNEFTMLEIDDYMNVINDYNIKNEMQRIDSELKQNIDINLKKEKLKKIVELKLRGEKND